MAKQDLDRIKEHLEYSEDHAKAAQKIAERVGDNSGAERIKEGTKKINEVRKHFDNDK